MDQNRSRIQFINLARFTVLAFEIIFLRLSVGMMGVIFICIFVVIYIYNVCHIDISIYIFFSTSVSLAENSGRLTWVKHSNRKTSATHFYQCVQCLCVLTVDWLPVFWVFHVADMLMRAIALGGCTDTVRDSALEVVSGRKIPCLTGDSNPRQYCAWLFSRKLYQLSYPAPNWFTFLVLLVLLVLVLLVLVLLLHTYTHKRIGIVVRIRAYLCL